MTESENRVEVEEVATETTEHFQRVATQEDRWSHKRGDFIQARIGACYLSDKKCWTCQGDNVLFSTYCFSCEKNFCGACDFNVHNQSPFHKRTQFFHEDYSSVKLKPTTFINLDGTLFEISM